MLAGLTGLLGGGGGAAGSFESIATGVGTGAAGAITFSSIPSTYKHLQVRVLGRSTTAATSGNCIIRFNGDTGSNYVNHTIRGTGAAITANGAVGQSSHVIAQVTGSTAAANIMGVAIYDILDYASTTKNKVTRVINGQDQNGSGDMWLGSGLWLNTAAITSIDFTATTAWATTTTIALYGIKG